MASRTQRRQKRHPLRKLGQLLLGGLLLLLLAGAGYAIYVIHQAPTITQAKLQANPGDENNQIYVRYDSIPENYRNAVIATEDRSFESNNGVNMGGLFNLITSNVLAQFGDGTARGGSSITQQLVKLTAFSTSKADQTPRRKIQEIYLALQLTKNFSKPQIFEYYTNKIYEGHELYGAQTIAYYYFGEPLSSLTLSQTAIIAGLGQSPTNFNLYTNPDLVARRRNIVLAAMLDDNKINHHEYEEAKATSVTDGLLPR
ncbi:penicillin-binding protein [Weissella cibaria]|uniref:biosynthetic peptidoglycan transglycosylase n=1 Tax=Weissella cibaria TaxID=137591 RepID=UPI000E4D74DA|nr:biosynthetic peptidoglycan transglycosylase [Weissella cibaria]RHE72078.1 penicillin-binding protein [Weissella cibaria]RHE78277.1 penicillin-binding protein [Weissella cibaria]